MAGINRTELVVESDLASNRLFLKTTFEAALAAFRCWRWRLDVMMRRSEN